MAENRLKILVCNKFYRPVGGPETVVLDSIRELKALGHEPIPFSMAHPENVPSEYANYFVQNVDYNAKHSQRGMSLVREAASLLYSKEARRQIERLIKDTKPDIAHAHNIYHQLSPSILSALKQAGVPTVLTLHDGKLLCANMLFLTGGKICERCAGRWFHNAVVHKCVKDSYASSLLCCVEETAHRMSGIYERNVDLFLAPSQFLKGKMVQHGRLKESSIEVLPNYADVNSWEPSYVPGDYAFFAGRIEPLKGVPTLWKACKEIPEFRVKLAGRGPLLEEGEIFCKENGLNEVQHLGFQTGDALKALFRESRFVALPSECYENSPMVILEAFAAGKPVIASRIGGIPELIEEGVDGLLFEPGNVQELASAMRRLVDNPDLAEEMGRRGRAKVEERYSLEAYMKSLVRVYNKALNRA